MGSTTRNRNAALLGSSFSILATSKCLFPIVLIPLIFSMWSPTNMPSILLTMLPSLIRLMNAKPAPLSVIVKPNASSSFMTSTSLGRPFTWAKIKSSKPIWPPNKRDISTLCVFSVQNSIYKKQSRKLSTLFIQQLVAQHWWILKAQGNMTEDKSWASLTIPTVGTLV